MRTAQWLWKAAGWTAQIYGGELVGELGWLMAKPHSADLVAIRDTELLWMGRALLDELAARSTAFSLAVARLCAERLYRTNHRTQSTPRARIFAIIPNGPEVDTVNLATSLAAELARTGRTELVWDHRASSHTAGGVGTANTANGARHTFVISKSRKSDLGTLPSGTSSAAFAINNSDVIAGVADFDGEVNHAVSWTHLKIMDLGTLPNGAGSSARAIDDRGQTVGFSDTPDGVHAFLYTDGAMRDSGTLGSDPSKASGVNNHGDVVGASNITNSKRHAFLRRKDRMTDLNNLLPAGTPWVLTDAFSNNDGGQIVCSARRKGEPLHLILLTPQ